MKIPWWTDSGSIPEKELSLSLVTTIIISVCPLLPSPQTAVSLKSLSFPLSLVISSSQVPIWYSWNSLGTFFFFLCLFLSGMFFTNICSGLFHPTQVFYSVVTFWVRSFLKTPNQNHIHPCHTHTYSNTTPGLIILLLYLSQSNLPCSILIYHVNCLFLPFRM